MRIKLGELRQVVTEEMERNLLRRFIDEAKLAAKPGMAKPGMKKPGEEEETSEDDEKLTELWRLINDLLVEVDVRKAQQMVNGIKGDIDAVSIQDIGSLENPMQSNKIKQLSMRIQDVDQYGPSGPKVAQALLRYLKKHVKKLSGFVSVSDREASRGRSPMPSRHASIPMPTAKRHAMRRDAA